VVAHAAASAPPVIIPTAPSCGVDPLVQKSAHIALPLVRGAERTDISGSSELPRYGCFIIFAPRQFGRIGLTLILIVRVH
jgi:hypothetical protein